MRTVRFVILMVCAAALLAPYGRADLGAQQPRQSEIRVLPVKGNIWMLVVDGSNIVASIGKDGILLVDTGPASMSDKVVAAVQALAHQITSPVMPQRSCVGIVQGCTWWNGSTFLATTVAPPTSKPIVGIINTSYDADHIGGNPALAAEGRSHVGVAAQEAWIMSHEKAPLHLPKGATTRLPDQTYDQPFFKLNHFNGEGVVLWHMPAAHTDGDTIVQFRGSDVLAAGDILNLTSYPVIDLEKGGSAQGEVDALNWILDQAVVEHMMEGGTMVVPGHGRLTDSADVAYYRDMMSIVRDRVLAAIKKKMTLEQVKAAKLTRDYDGRFGRNPSYTPDMFIEAVYRSLNPKS